VDPEVAALREQRIASGFVPIYELSVEEARQADLERAQDEGGEPEPVENVEEREVDGPDGNRIRLRMYDPGAERPAGALVYFFGGGWVVGSLETADGICRALANRSRCLVIATDYRLAPEHPFPAAAQDAIAATRWTVEHAGALGIDPDRIAVGGESAGGNLAAVAAQHAVRLAFQLLIYPVTDRAALTGPPPENEEPYFFSTRSMAWYWGHYLPDESNTDPLASPLRADSLAGLPPALVITAELDALRPEGEAYARRLEEAGVPVTLTNYDGMVHGFVGMAGELSAGRRALDEAGAALRRAVGPR
jgi:acetyl esterase